MDESENSYEALANAIEFNVKELQKQCKDPKRRDEIKMTEVVMVMENIAVKLTENHGHLLEAGFLGHLQIISELEIDESIEFVDHFTRITQLMCETCLKAKLRLMFIDSLLIQWFSCVRKLSSTSKLTVFGDLKSTEFKKCAQFITDAQCISSKVQMFNILCSYLQNDSDPLVKLSSLFENIVEQHTLDIIQSAEWKTDGISLQSKLWILERINHWQRAIYSELVDSMEFGTAVKIPFEHNNGRFYFNKSAKTVEFWMEYKSKTVLVTISARKMRSVQVLESEKYFAQNLKFILNAPPRLKTENGKAIDLPEFQVTTINVVFDTGIYRRRLDAMLLEMFGITPEVIHLKKNEDVDSDVEITGVIYKPLECSTIDISSQSPSHAKESNLKQSDKKQISMKKNAERKVPLKSDTKKQIVSTTQQRSRRAAAKKAIEGISKSLEDSICIPDVTPCKWIDLESKKREIGMTKGRKLWSGAQNQKQIQQQTDDEEKSPKKCRRIKDDNNVELTPTSFRYSIYKDPARHILENASRINEDVEKTANPINCYPNGPMKIDSKRAEYSAKPSSSMCDSKKANIQKDKTTPMNGPENTDMNLNNKQCSCQQLKSIDKKSRHALVALRSNKYKCTECGGIQKTSHEY